MIRREHDPGTTAADDDTHASERGEQGTNYPHGFGDHPDAVSTTEVEDPIASERGTQGTNYPHGVGDYPDGESDDEAVVEE